LVDLERSDLFGNTGQPGLDRVKRWVYARKPKLKAEKRVMLVEKL